MNSKILKNLIQKFITKKKKYEVLNFPYPYRKMLAINSDVEWTGWSAQNSLIRTFSNLGLECSFSYWFFAGGDKTWSMFNSMCEKSVHYDEAVKLAKQGFLDSIHSIGGRKHAGGVDFNRDDIFKGYDTLEKSGVRTRIYSNHGSEYDTQNIGGDWATYQLGDVPGSDAYHLNRTLNHGVRYFWTDIDYTVDDVYLESTVNQKTSLFRTQSCRDGNSIICFRRYLGKLSQGPSADNFEHQLDQVIDAVDEGYTVIYQHLGVHRDNNGRPHSAKKPFFSDHCLQSLEKLAQLHRQGNILVTTTEKLLNHALIMTARPWNIHCEKQTINIYFSKSCIIGNVSTTIDRDDLSGWSILVNDELNVEMFFNEKSLEYEVEQAGKNRVCTIPWRK